jgi:hypothetical protein
VQYVAYRGFFFFCYQLRTQFCDVRKVLVCNLWRKGEPSDSVSLNSSTLLCANGVRLQYVTHRRKFCFCYHLRAQLSNVRKMLNEKYVSHRGNFCYCYHLRSQIYKVRTVLDCNVWNNEKLSSSVIT